MEKIEDLFGEQMMHELPQLTTEKENSQCNSALNGKIWKEAFKK